MTETIITVRGQHTARFAAELATIQLAVAVDGADRDAVFDEANRTAGDLRTGITALHDKEIGPVIRWSSNSVRVWGGRPWNSEGKRLPLVYHSTIDFSATFIDFDALARFIETAVEMPGVAIGQLDWELTRDHAAAASNDVRLGAVQDAVAKATSYATALGLGSVRATAIADPGMLGNESNATGTYELASAHAFLKGGQEPELSLKPEDIEVSIAVDARFVASR